MGEQFSILVHQWFAIIVASTSEHVVELSENMDLKFLAKVFDELDEDETEMCPRLDLRKRIETYVHMDSRIQLLVDMIRNLDAMIVDRDEYLVLVGEWIASCAQVGGTGTYSVVTESSISSSDAADKAEDKPDAGANFDRSAERAQARNQADERKRADEARDAKFKEREEKRKAKAKAKANKGRNY